MRPCEDQPAYRGGPIEEANILGRVIRHVRTMSGLKVLPREAKPRRSGGSTWEHAHDAWDGRRRERDVVTTAEPCDDDLKHATEFANFSGRYGAAVLKSTKSKRLTRL